MSKVKQTALGIRNSAQSLVGINPCATKQPALCLLDQGDSPAELENWTLDIDYWIFNSSLSASGGFGRVGLLDIV